MTEQQIYVEAGKIIQIAMGREKVRRKTVWSANEDPLGYWCGVENIVSLVQRATSPTLPVGGSEDE